MDGRGCGEQQKDQVRGVKVNRFGPKYDLSSHAATVSAVLELISVRVPRPSTDVIEVHSAAR